MYLVLRRPHLLFVSLQQNPSFQSFYSLAVELKRQTFLVQVLNMRMLSQCLQNCSEQFIASCKTISEINKQLNINWSRSTIPLYKGKVASNFLAKWTLANVLLSYWHCFLILFFDQNHCQFFFHTVTFSYWNMFLINVAQSNFEMLTFGDMSKFHSFCISFINDSTDTEFGHPQVSGKAFFRKIYLQDMCVTIVLYMLLCI